MHETETPTGTSLRAAPCLTPGGLTHGSGLLTPSALSCGALAHRLPPGQTEALPAGSEEAPAQQFPGLCFCRFSLTPGPLRAAGQEGTHRAGDRHALGERPQVGSGEAALSHQVRALTSS